MIMTATLPPFVQDLLDIALLETTRAAGNEYSTGAKPYQKATFTNDQIRHSLKIFHDRINSEFIHQLFCERAREGSSNKLLVLCNTVKKAQQLYVELSKAYPFCRLIHAKFTRKDRKKLEDEILADGRSGCDKSVIWIATQIVEASLDIDFDYLVTEMSDLSALMQRLGRVNRKGLKSILNTNCFIFTEIDPKLLISEDERSGFIDPDIYYLSCQAIATCEGPLSENEKNRLIDEWLTTEKLQARSSPIRGYINSYKSFRSYVEKLYVGQIDNEGLQQKFRNIDSQVIIPEPVYVENRATIDASITEFIKLQTQLTLSHQEKTQKVEKQALFLQIQAEKNKLESYSLSVPVFDVHRCGPQFDLGFNEFITVSACHYDHTIGFQRMKRAELLSLGVSAQKDYDNEIDNNPIL